MRIPMFARWSRQIAPTARQDANDRDSDEGGHPNARDGGTSPRPPDFARPTRGRAAGIVILTLGVVAVLAWLDRHSVERANRVFRAGDAMAAEALYRQVAADPGKDPRLSFNLGTARLATGATNADQPLRVAAQAADSVLAQRVSYNLAYALLELVEPALATDSAVTLLEASVASGRRAVRLDPRNEDARWNLALAQRMLDSLTFQYRDSDREEVAGKDETRLEERSLTRSSSGTGISGLEPDDPRAAQGNGQRSGGSIGAREAWTTQDPGPISPAAARSMLGSLDDDPEQLVRGILWSHRPEVAWWNSEPYPGGDW